MNKSAVIENNEFVDMKMYNEIKILIEDSRNKVYSYVNSTMVRTYWAIGKIIVEYQGGEEKAKYGNKVISELSKQMTYDFGKGYDERNLRYMRHFYLSFPIWNTVCSELSWSHYRLLISIQDTQHKLVL